MNFLNSVESKHRKNDHGSQQDERPQWETPARSISMPKTNEREERNCEVVVASVLAVSTGESNRRCIVISSFSPYGFI